MKLLRITVDGLPLFKDELDLRFYAQQRVAEDDKNALIPLFSNVYMNSTNGFIGINASGKTSVLKVILLVLNLVNNEPINHIETREILGGAKQVVINSFFLSEKTNELCRLETFIETYYPNFEEPVYRITSERLWEKKQRM